MLANKYSSGSGAVEEGRDGLLYSAASISGRLLHVRSGVSLWGMVAERQAQFKVCLAVSPLWLRSIYPSIAEDIDTEQAHTYITKSLRGLPQSKVCLVLQLVHCSNEMGGTSNAIIIVHRCERTKLEMS